MFGFVKKKDYDLLKECIKNKEYMLHGTQVIWKGQEKQTELEYKRAEYWKAKALHPDSEPYVEGDMKTVKYVKSWVDETKVSSIKGRRIIWYTEFLVVVTVIGI